jgi:hypothetical protein
MDAQYDEADRVLQDAAAFLSTTDAPIFRADLKIVTAEALRDRGRWEEAVIAYRAGIDDYERLGMTALLAYNRIVLAESLIVLGRHKEAEKEIREALPTIEEQEMVREGLAAVGLLKESIKRRKADPNALRELREHLQDAKKRYPGLQRP